MYLTGLPTEVILVILEFLAAVNLKTFLRLQATSKRLRLLVHDVLSGPTSQRRVGHKATVLSNPQVQALFKRYFGPLFRSADCFTPSERGRTLFLTLDGDHTRPFRCLPWATHIEARRCFLGPGASWRSISVTFGSGSPITHLDIVKTYSGDEYNDEGRDHVQYLQVDLSASGHTGYLTMGLLYDLLLCGGRVGDINAATFGGETGSWELLLGKRLVSYDVLYDFECFIASDEELVDSSSHAAQAAILYVQGGTVDVHHQGRAEETDDWEPQVLGQLPKLLAWQGPEPDINNGDLQRAIG